MRNLTRWKKRFRVYLLEWTPTTVQITSTRKSRSRDKGRQIEISDFEDERHSLISPTRSLVTGNAGTTYSQVFPDTAVAFKAMPTPVRAEKQKPDTDLGVAPSQSSTATVNQFLPSTSQVVAQPSPVARTSSALPMSWEPPATQNVATDSVNKQLSRDMKHNLLPHTDQFGKAVQIQGLVNKPSHTLGSQGNAAGMDVAATQSQEQQFPQMLEALRVNLYIQQLVEERISVFEARMKTELSQGNSTLRKKSERYNISDTPCVKPHLRWPNEACLTGASRKHTPYDDLTLGQYVVGFLNNALEVHNGDLQKNMLTELVEMVKLSGNLSWPIARGALAMAMHRIEDEAVAWTDTRFLADNHLTYSQTAVFNGSVTMSPRTGMNTQTRASNKRVVCKWYNEGSCPHPQDHLDSSGLTTFRHICMYCFKNLKRNNNHTEFDC